MENENEVVTPNDTDTTVNAEETVNDEEISLEVEGDDTTEDDKDKVIATLKAQKEHWKKKATEKTPDKPKEVIKETKEQPKAEGLSQTDIIAIVKNDIHEDDVSDIQDYARLKGVSVSSAIKSDFIQTLLRDKNEKRNTAKATSVKNVRTGNASVSDETLMENAKKGVLPDNDKDLERIVKGRFGIK